MSGALAAPPPVLSPALRRCFGLSVTLALGIATAAVSPAAAQLTAPRLWGPLAPGAHDVGFEVLTVRDSTRPLFESGVARPIQVSLWYPAVNAAADTPRLRYRDYFLLTASERTLRVPEPAEAAAAIARFKQFLAADGVASTAVEAWFASPMAAVRGAAPAPGAYPLVLIAQGNFQAAYNQAILAEYLASHGYVVATTPSQSRITGPPAEDAPVIRAARDQALDLSRAVALLGPDPRVDTSRVAIVAHSFGTRSALLLTRDIDLGAFVSLDGGIASAHGRDWLNGVPFDLDRVTVPILHLYGDLDPEIIEPDFALLESLSEAHRTIVKVDSLHHLHFGSLGFVSGLVPGLRAGPPSPAVVEKCTAIAAATRAFLDAHLRHAAILDATALNRRFFSTSTLEPA